MAAKDQNPIVETYRGVKIRKYPSVHLRTTVSDYKKFIDAKKDFGLSPLEAIRSQKIYCKPCEGFNISSTKKQ